MKQRSSLRPVRFFSEAIKKKAVEDIEGGKVTVLAVSREYNTSFQTVYRWLNKYSRHLKSSKRIVVEMESEGYRSKELEKRIQELEAALGRKQLEIDFLNKLIEKGNDELGIDLKKKSSLHPSVVQKQQAAAWIQNEGCV
jgi:transposase-like protein